MLMVVVMGAVAVWAAVRLTQLPSQPSVIVAALVGAGIGLAIAAVASAVDGAPISLPARVVGAAFVPTLLVLSLAVGAFVGCSGASSCVRPIPQSFFPEWVRALSAGVVGAATLGLTAVFPYMAITGKACGTRPSTRMTRPGADESLPVARRDARLRLRHSSPG